MLAIAIVQKAMACCWFLAPLVVFVMVKSGGSYELLYHLRARFNKLTHTVVNVNKSQWFPNHTMGTGSSQFYSCWELVMPHES